MLRRDFLKTASCITCITALNSGCQNFFISNSNSQNKQSIDLPESFLNNLKNEKFYYKSKKDLPKSISLEACSLCQLDCPACYVRSLEKNAPKDWLGYLKFENFKKLVDDNEFDRIELSHRGEIFLNPELDEIIEYAYNKRVKLTAATGVNLNTVSEKTLENLVKYGFWEMKVSIDGATPETYKIYRRGGDFDTVINNIKIINKFKKQYKTHFPMLKWQFIPFGHNEHEIELAKKKAEELDMEIKYTENYDSDYSPLKNPKRVKELTDGIIDEKEYAKYVDIRLKKNKCMRIFEQLQIDYNGDLLCHNYLETKGLVCCNNKFNCNVFEQGFLEALNSPDYIYAKKMLTDFTVEPKKGVVCTNCNKYKSMRKDNKQLIL